MSHRGDRCCLPTIWDVINGPVHWGTYDGEFLERVMAVLVAQDHPNVIRRTPARGDGGIDLMIPDGDGYIVEQVKSFTGRMGTSQRRQVEDSWATLNTKPRLDKSITAYRLVVPIDPTPDEQAWFEKLVIGASIACEWRGETHWNSLAARHAHVIDYYFNGGRDRITTRAKALLAATADPTQPVTPLSVGASLDTMRAALDRDDPHYRYEFATSTTPPNPLDLVGCVLANTQPMTDGGFLTITVVPKHSYALEDSPIKGTLRVEFADPVEADRFQEAFEGFSKFGRALDLPEGSLWATLDAPGGLGGTIEGGHGTIVPAVATDPPTHWRIAVVDDTETKLAEVPLTTESRTVGPLGGAEIIMIDASKALTVTLRLDPPKADGAGIAFNITAGTLPGRPVVAVTSVARFLASLIPPNEMRILPEYGAQVLSRYAFREDAGLLHDGVATHIEDLAYIQDLADLPLTVPEEFDPPFAAELHNYVRMMRGEVTTGTWDEVTVNLKDGYSREALVNEFAGGGAFRIEQTRLVNIDDRDIDLGPFTTTLASVSIAEEQPPDTSTIRLVPGDDHTYTTRAGAVQG